MVRRPGIEWFVSLFQSVVRFLRVFQDKVKDIAINDASLLQNSCFYLIQKHHKRQPYYVDLLDLIHSTELDAGIGRLNERVMAAPGATDLNKFSGKRFVVPNICFRCTQGCIPLGSYQQIATYKTAIPFFYVPVAAAMRLVSINVACVKSSLTMTNARVK